MGLTTSVVSKHPVIRAVRRVASKRRIGKLKALRGKPQNSLLPQGLRTWTLQQDNDPAHKLAPEIVRQYNLRHGCSIAVLPNWPPSNPDLSLIENVWSILQSRLDSHGCKTFPDFKAALVKEAESSSRSLAQGMFDGIAARVQECIKKGGDRTRH
jgi:hypothetical protein